MLFNQKCRRFQLAYAVAKKIRFFWRRMNGKFPADFRCQKTHDIECRIS